MLILPAPIILKKWRYTTGFATIFVGGSIVYKSETQSVAALSSKETDLFVAVAA